MNAKKRANKLKGYAKKISIKACKFKNTFN